MVPLSALNNRLFPPIPAEIAAEVDLLRHARLQAQVPLLYMTMTAVVIAAMLAANANAPLIFRAGIPILVTIIGLVRLFWWLEHRPDVSDAANSARINRRATIISATVAAICTLWAIGSWLYAPPEARAYFILFMAMGSLSAAFSLASMRVAALLYLALAVVPTALVLILLGSDMDRISALVEIIAACFLARMILQQHDQMVAMLMLKHQLRIEADSDPLTSLANRRALHRAMVENDARPLALALIDLDGFKAVNDSFGHAVGDQLLVAVAQRMRGAAGDALVARLGGDEFALLAPGGTGAMRRRVDHILIELARPFELDGRTLAIGASAGVAQCQTPGCDALRLLDLADKQLYAAKAARPQRGARAKSGRAKPVRDGVTPVAAKIAAR